MSCSTRSRERTDPDSGRGLAVKDYGFLFNNELGNFNARPLFEGDPNVAAPGKRPRGNMAPTIVQFKRHMSR
ncbi:gamma-glutamyltransferase [Streptosporangium soli]